MSYSQSNDGFFISYGYQQPQQTAQYASGQSPFYDPSTLYSQQDYSQQIYVPTDTNQTMNGDKTQTPNFDDDEVPLLEELGINFEHIYRKTICVLNPVLKPDDSIINDADLSGPLVFGIAYGFSLLLHGKIQFGYVYGLSVLGCVCMYSLLNLMSDGGVSAIMTSSTLGYCLLPMVFLSFISNVINIKSIHGIVIALLFILWCSVSASKLFVNALKMKNQQILVLYPCLLLYGIFALLNIY